MPAPRAQKALRARLLAVASAGATLAPIPARQVLVLAMPLVRVRRVPIAAPRVHRVQRARAPALVMPAIALPAGALRVRMSARRAPQGQPAQLLAADSVAETRAMLAAEPPAPVQRPPQEAQRARTPAQHLQLARPAPRVLFELVVATRATRAAEQHVLVLLPLLEVPPVFTSASSY